MNLQLEVAFIKREKLLKRSGGVETGFCSLGQHLAPNPVPLKFLTAFALACLWQSAEALRPCVTNVLHEACNSFDFIRIFFRGWPIKRACMKS
jgi:hypothetical protein